MSGQESDTFRGNVRVRMPDTPVVDIEINPHVCLVPDQPFRSVPKHTLTCIWYRKQVSSPCQADTRCSIHDDKLAKIQCLYCMRLRLPAEASYFCSPSCFNRAWKVHKVSHDRAYETDRTTKEKEGRGLGTHDSWHYKKSTEIEWFMVCCSKSYKPTSDDMGFILKLEVLASDRSRGTKLAPIKIVETEPVITAPNCEPRRIIKCSPNNGNFDTKVPSSNKATFSVLSYNVLTNVCATGGRYDYCPPWALVWEYRRQKLLNEIIEYDADIICLQEVQSDHFGRFFEPEMKKRGYSVIYTKKTSKVYTGKEFVSDGCATFYRHKLFKVKMKHEVEFEKQAEDLVKKLAPHLQKKYNIRLKKDNVAQIALLETSDSKRFHDALRSRIYVANTHIHANSDNPDVKLFQVVRLINALEAIVQTDNTPLLICGDLNSLPLSAPHRFVVSGRCDLVDEKMKKPFVDEKMKDHLELFDHLKIKHSLPLASAYASFSLSAGNEKPQPKMDMEAKEPLFTSFTPYFSGTLDYIFYTDNSLRVEGLLNLLDRGSLAPGIPSSLWPSDHIALMAIFSFKPPPTRPEQRSLWSPPYWWQKTAARR